MFPDSTEDIFDYPNAQYGVKLIFDRMVIFQSVEIERNAEEEESQNEDSLIDRAKAMVEAELYAYYGLNINNLGLQDIEIELEAVSR